MRAESAPIYRSIAALERRIASRGAERVVLANGCFDPLHVGHVRYLEGARACGDFLVVAINDDPSTRQLKGKGRPVSPVGDRSQIVGGVGAVDSVLVFSAPDVSKILERLRPAVHAKGTDYTVETVPEREASVRLGIETLIVGDPKSHASTEVLRRVQRSRDLPRRDTRGERRPDSE